MNNYWTGIILFVFLSTLFQGCGHNGDKGPQYAVGDFAFGGVVAYVLTSSDPGYEADIQHGIVVNIFEQTAQWGCFGSILVGANGWKIGDGKQNTLDILVGCNTQEIAAKLCDELIIDVYSDWYLPSLSELETVYYNKDIINTTALQHGGIDQLNGWYWTSTEANFDGLPIENAQSAAVVNFDYVKSTTRTWNISFDDPLNYVKKDSLLKVRAIRAF